MPANVLAAKSQRAGEKALIEPAYCCVSLGAVRKGCLGTHL